MSKYTFICEHNSFSPNDSEVESTHKVYHEIKNEYRLLEIISEFEIFLKGVGFVFEGKLEISELEEK